MGWATGEHNIVFYVDNVRIAGRNIIWVQTTLKVVARIFERVVLKKNLGRTKAIGCTVGFIQGKLGVAEHNQRVTGEGDTFRE